MNDRHWNSERQEWVYPQLSDEAWQFIKDTCGVDTTNHATFEGDWGNWNWLFKELSKR